MISLYTNTGLQLDVPTGKITFELNFPGLDPETIQQSFAFAVTFPPSPSNDKAFSSARLINVSRKVKEISVEIYLSGCFWRKGKIIFADAGSDGYRGSIILDEIFVEQVDRSLKDLNYGANIPLGNSPSTRVASAKSLAQQHGFNGTNPCTFFPVYNPWFYGGATIGTEGYGEGPNPDFNGIINEFNAESILESTRTFFYNSIPADVSEPMNKYALVPFFYHHFILSKIFDKYNFDVSGTFWFDNEARTAVLYNNFPLDYKRRRRYVHVSALPDQEITWNSANFQKLELYINSVIDEDIDGRFNAANSSYSSINSGPYLIKVKGLAYGFFTFLNLPGTFAGQLRIKIQGAGTGTVLLLDIDQFMGTPGGFQFSGETTIGVIDETAEITIEAVCVTEPGSIKIEWAEVSFENILANNLNEFASEISPVNHVPDVQISTYLNELRKFFGVTFIFDPLTRQLQIDFVDDYLEKGSGKVIPIETPKTLTKRFRAAKSLRYQFDWSSADDELIKDNFKSLSGLTYQGAGFTLVDPQVNDCFLRPDVGQIQVYKNGEFQYYSDYYPSQLFGDYPEIAEVSLQMTPLLMRRISYAGSRLVMPAVRQQANSPAFELDHPISALRTTFYRGYIQGIAASPDIRTVPSGSSFAIDQYEQSIGQTAMSLNDCGAPGLITQHLQQLVNLKVYSDLVITRVGLTLDQILSLSWKDRWMTSGIHLIPVKLTFETSPNKLSQIEAELYTDFSGYDGES